MTKYELFSKVEAIRAEAYLIISDDSKQERFDELMVELAGLKAEAKKKGWRL